MRQEPGDFPFDPRSSMHPPGCASIFAAGIAALIAIGFVLLWAGGAFAHDATNVQGQPLGWKYPWACCSSMDCGPVPESDISEGPDGYTVKSTGEVVGYADKRVKDSPDGTFHICAHKQGIDAGKVICLYRPPRGY
jgi:hypothetical protein